MKVQLTWFVKMVVPKATRDENHWSAASQLSPWEAPRSVTFCSHNVALFLPTPNHQCKQEVKNKHLCRRRLQTDGYMDLEVCMVLWQFYKTVLLQYGMKKAVDTLHKQGLLMEQHKDLLLFQFGRPADAGNTYFPILLSLKGDFHFDTSHGP